MDTSCVVAQWCSVGGRVGMGREQLGRTFMAGEGFVRCWHESRKEQ